MLKWLRAVARFFQNTIGWNRIGVLLSLTIIAVALVVLGLAFVKGMLVALEFLELREAPALWRWLIAGWLVLVLGLIVLAYALGLPKA